MLQTQKVEAGLSVDRLRQQDTFCKPALICRANGESSARFPVQKWMSTLWKEIMCNMQQRFCLPHASMPGLSWISQIYVICECSLS